MSDLCVLTLAQMYDVRYITLRQHMMLFNTSVLMASQVSQLADVYRPYVGRSHELRIRLSRILWPGGPRYTSRCVMCSVPYCVCAGRAPVIQQASHPPAHPPAPMIAQACHPPAHLVILEHVETPPGEAYTPTLSPAYSYSSAFANLAHAMDHSHTPSNEDDSGDDNGEDNRSGNEENDMDNTEAGNNGEGDREDSSAESNLALSILDAI